MKQVNFKKVFIAAACAIAASVVSAIVISTQSMITAKAESQIKMNCYVSIEGITHKCIEPETLKHCVSINIIDYGNPENSAVYVCLGRLTQWLDPVDDVVFPIIPEPNI